MSHCPSEAELLSAALDRDGASHAESAIGTHIGRCARCGPKVAELRAVAHALSASAASTPSESGECLDENALASLIGGVKAEHRMRYLPHLASCGKCRRALAALAQLLATPEVAAEMSKPSGAPARRVERLSPRRWAAVAAGTAAAALVLLFVMRDEALDRSTDHRGPTVTAVTQPRLAFPVGDAAAVSVLRWRSVDDANRYRVTLFDALGGALLETETADTMVVLPDSVRLMPGQSYLWKVEARTEFDRWSSSELVEFRILGGDSTQASVRPSALPLRARGDSLGQVVRRLSDAELSREVQLRPADIREAVAGLLAQASRDDASVELSAARRLARAHAAAWSDPFLTAEVARFAAWAPRARTQKALADSLRRAGNEAFRRHGADAAIRIWRSALRASTSAGDSSGIAAALGNIGAAMAWDGRPDAAADHLGRARAIAAAIGDLRVEANALAELAGLRELHGDLAAARDLYLDARDRRMRSGDTRGLASDYNNLSAIARAEGDLGRASRELEAALAMNRRDGRPEAVATNLVNLAGLASLDGELERAERYYREALALWQPAGFDADIADARLGLGELALRRGDYSAAQAHLRHALDIYRRTGPQERALETQQRLASAHAAAGQLQTALDVLRDAERIAQSAPIGAGARAGMTLVRADLTVQLNLRAKAGPLYDSAAALFRQAGDASGEAEAQQGRAALLLDLDDPARAQAFLESALRTHRRAGNLRAAAVARWLLAESHLRAGDTVGAQRELLRASGEVERLGDRVAAAVMLGERAAVHSARGEAGAAESLYRRAIESLGADAPDASWRLHAGLASVQLSRGATEAAARALRRAIAGIESTGNTLVLPERLSSFLDDKSEVYIRLALLESHRGRADRGFQVSEQLRARGLRDLLARGRIAAPPQSPELASLEQDLRRRMADLARQAEWSPSSGERDRDLSAAEMKARSALLDAHARYADLQLEIGEHAARGAVPVRGATPSWQSVARRLAPDEALIEYLLSDTAAVAFVVTRDTVAAVPLPTNRRRVAQLTDFVRGTIEPVAVAGAGARWRPPLRQLYAELVAPVEAQGRLRGVRRLTIVPHAELHYLPFAALIDGGARERFLIERYEVATTPSAAVWLALGARKVSSASTGMLAFAPRPEALPASVREVGAIERLGRRRSRVMVGGAATEAAFRRHAPSRKVVHLATYGVLNTHNPLFSFVELAPEGTHDGRLEVHEVFGIPLQAELVVLSACQTGLASGAVGDVPAGDDWIGLVRAFLAAGAHRVLATLWPVQDRASAELMERFYESYVEGEEPGRALASAQRAMLQRPETASPYYWAGFQLVGGALSAP